MKEVKNLQIVINIEKKHLYAFVLLISLFGSFAYAYNSGGTGGDPSVMGHSFDEVGLGTYEFDAADLNSFKLFRPQTVSSVNGPALFDIIDDGWSENPGSRQDWDYSLHVKGNTMFQGPVRVLTDATNPNMDTKLVLCDNVDGTLSCYNKIGTISGVSHPLCVTDQGVVGLC
ncbi:hypothetical protein HN865_01595 [Candidatus Woesearchaeota archaeon]|jgi:hypothetical protein|nr:hypothetical protein [Candidatus Woesearchaeota archaeon]MBT7237530.1 hypothetical protein [Candidatus Woesearchaeota archaeon]